MLVPLSSSPPWDDLTLWLLCRAIEKKLAIGVHIGLPAQECRHENMLPIGADRVRTALLDVSTVFWGVLHLRHSVSVPCGLESSEPVWTVATTAADTLSIMNKVTMVANSRSRHPPTVYSF